VFITSAQQATTTIRGLVSDPANDPPLQYRWLEGTDELLSWTAVGSTGYADLPLSGINFAPAVGEHSLMLEARNAQATASDVMILTINNSAPTVSPTGGGSYRFGDSTMLGGDASDFDGDTLDYQWTEGDITYCFGQLATVVGGTPVQLPDCAVTLGLGIHSLATTVWDDVNVPVTEPVTVEVIDRTAPTLSPKPSMGILWPPNHKMVNVSIITQAADNTGVMPTLSVEEISSDEPQSGTDSSDLSPDWANLVVDQTSGVVTLQLRAERAGTGNGREYTIKITATDQSNNSTEAEAKIIVPHDQREK
jgi:hypothetical protein